jgi:hypothetical protein
MALAAYRLVSLNTMSTLRAAALRWTAALAAAPPVIVIDPRLASIIDASREIPSHETNFAWTLRWREMDSNF